MPARLLPPALLALVLGGALLSGCAGGEGATSGATPSPRPSASATTAPEGRDAVCERVRAGIDAFNAGDFDTTVERFRAALPLARAAREDDSSTESRLLLRAVRYYAELPADQYANAARGSVDFQRWKAVTLTLCVSGQDQLSPGPEPQDPAIPA